MSGIPMLEFTVYHKLLRISSLVLAIVLLFQSGLVSDTTARLTAQTESYLANVVGVYVGVEPTELNQLTAQLTERELALAAREAALAEREIGVNLNGGGLANQSTATFVLGIMLFILLVLIVLNYALDYVRAERELRSRVAEEVHSL